MEQLKEKCMQQLYSTFISIFVLGKLDIFEDYKIWMIKLGQMRERNKFQEAC